MSRKTSLPKIIVTPSQMYTISDNICQDIDSKLSEISALNSETQIELPGSYEGIIDPNRKQTIPEAQETLQSFATSSLGLCDVFLESHSIFLEEIKQAKDFLESICNKLV